MKITFIAIGVTDSPAIKTLTADYEKRLGRLTSFCIEEIPDIKNGTNFSENEQKLREGREILSRIKPSDRLILLDERGKGYSSVDFSALLQQQMNSGIKNLVFAAGGPYGFSQDVYTRADGMLSLSKMTFSHQMVRLFFTEQLYRALTILRGMPYHHQ